MPISSHLPWSPCSMLVLAPVLHLSNACLAASCGAFLLGVPSHPGMAGHACLLQRTQSRKQCTVRMQRQKDPRICFGISWFGQPTPTSTIPCSRLRKVGTWMQHDLCSFSFFHFFGIGGRSCSNVLPLCSPFFLIWFVFSLFGLTRNPDLGTTVNTQPGKREAEQFVAGICARNGCKGSSKRICKQRICSDCSWLQYVKNGRAIAG